MSEEVRGQNGGRARKEKLPEAQRKSIASEAAKRRWSEVRRKKAEAEVGATVTATIIGEVTPANIVSDEVYTSSPTITPIAEPPEEKEPKHCPACLAGESLEEGEGTHILATVEHPVTLPAGFDDAEASVAIQTPPQKPAKRQAKPMPKEFKSAGSYAEKRVLAANKERAVHVGEITKHQAKIHELDAEINGLLPIIRALGGKVDVPAPSYTNGAPYQPTQPTGPQLPPRYPEYATPQAIVPDVAPVPRMKQGGVGALDLGFLANE